MPLSSALEVICFFCQILAQAIPFVMIELVHFFCSAAHIYFLVFTGNPLLKQIPEGSTGHALPLHPAVFVQESPANMRNLCLCSGPG